jgi:hypothetical protein
MPNSTFFWRHLRAPPAPPYSIHGLNTPLLLIETRKSF